MAVASQLHQFGKSRLRRTVSHGPPLTLFIDPRAEEKQLR